MPGSPQTNRDRWKAPPNTNRLPEGSPFALVEVGGVEPPSENLSVQASTCVAGVFFSSPGNPAGRAPDDQPIGFHPADPGPGLASLACLYDALISPGKRGKEDVAAS